MKLMMVLLSELDFGVQSRLHGRAIGLAFDDARAIWQATVEIDLAEIPMARAGGDQAVGRGDGKASGNGKNVDGSRQGTRIAVVVDQLRKRAAPAGLARFLDEHGSGIGVPADAGVDGWDAECLGEGRNSTPGWIVVDTADDKVRTVFSWALG